MNMTYKTKMKKIRANMWGTNSANVTIVKDGYTAEVFALEPGEKGRRWALPYCCITERVPAAIGYYKSSKTPCAIVFWGGRWLGTNHPAIHGVREWYVGDDLDDLPAGDVVKINKAILEEHSLHRNWIC